MYPENKLLTDFKNYATDLGPVLVDTCLAKQTFNVHSVFLLPTCKSSELYVAVKIVIESLL